MSESKGFQFGTAGALSLSVVSSVSIVICNKALISTLGFSFGELSIRSSHELAAFCLNPLLLVYAFLSPFLSLVVYFLFSLDEYLSHISFHLCYSLLFFHWCVSFISDFHA